MRTLVLDAGAFVAAERFDQTFSAYIREAARLGVTILIPAPVIAEVWRRPPRAGSAGLLSSATEIVSLDTKLAQDVGNSMGTRGSAHIVDATVASLAVSQAPSLVITSDVGDIVQLVTSAGATCHIGATPGTHADVVIQQI